MSIHGYTYGTAAVARSPVSLADFEEMKKSVLLGDEDLRYLRMSNEVVKAPVEPILADGFVGANPHLLASFTGASDAKPLGDYLAGVRRRFGQWILDTARAGYDQAWLDYQHEIGLRHHRTKKNQTDGAPSTAIVPFRHLFALVFPVTLTLRPFLAKGGHSAADVDGMHAAWVKSTMLQVTLWSHAYVKDGDF